MHTVIETRAYLAAADAAGMTEDERAGVVLTVAAAPSAGEMMAETGGCRKVRVAGRSKGKSGGYRVITYFGGGDIPVFLLTVFSKGERANLSRGERNELGKLAKTLRTSLAGQLTGRVAQLRRRT